MRRRHLLRTAALAGLALPALRAPLHAAEKEAVDVELVLAVDVSRSVDETEQELQFRGYEAAFRDPRLIEGIAGGAIGAIGVTLFTWSDWHIQEHLVPWMKLDGPRSAQAFADRLAEAPRRTHLYTSISGAMDYAGRLFGQRYEGMRRVVDISGDGINNSGRPLAEARTELLAQGVVVNGLAVIDNTPVPPSLAGVLPPLDEYYRDEVIGGPGAFLVVAEGFTAFEAAVRRKIIREIALAPPSAPQVVRVG